MKQYRFALILVAAFPALLLARCMVFDIPTLTDVEIDGSVTRIGQDLNMPKRMHSESFARIGA